MQTLSERIDKDWIQSLSNRLLQSDCGSIKNWRCEPIGPVRRNFVTGGVYRISGESDVRGGATQSWSIILKIVNADPNRDDPSHYNYWRREIMVYDSGFLLDLPANIKSPECFAIDVQDDGSVWLWLEDIRNESKQWDWNDYAFATEMLGELHAAFLLSKKMPEYQWLNRRWMRSWIHECYRYRQVPNETAISELLRSDERVAAIYSQFTQFEELVHDWLEELDRLPRTVSHQDYYENNILLNDKDKQEGKLTLIDWQFVSISGIGEDLGRFFGLFVSREQVTVEQFMEYRELFYSSYIKGMRRAGWDGDENLPRFGFLAAFAIRSIWEVPKLLKKLEADSPDVLQLMLVTEQQMEAVKEVERLRLELSL